jgi:hypothetical protein
MRELLSEHEAKAHGLRIPAFLEQFAERPAEHSSRQTREPSRAHLRDGQNQRKDRPQINERFQIPWAPQHLSNFVPLPHGQGSLRPTLAASRLCLAIPDIRQESSQTLQLGIRKCATHKIAHYAVTVGFTPRASFPAFLTTVPPDY